MTGPTYNQGTRTAILAKTRSNNIFIHALVRNRKEDFCVYAPRAVFHPLYIYLEMSLKL